MESPAAPRSLAGDTAPPPEQAHAAELTAADVTQAYRRYAPFYDRLFGLALEPGRRALAEQVVALAPQRLLEIGVGTGLLLPRYPGATAVTGIDLSAEMLDIARARAASLHGRDIRLAQADGEGLDFAAGAFDCVTLPYVLSVTPAPQRLMAEARRVCRPGGTIVVLNHFSGSRSWWLAEQLVKPLAARIGFRSSFRLEEQLPAREWNIESVRPVNLFGLSRLIVIRNG
jgi:phosphatidylethanolamine/phosphatidyl-N-methylethanolamine N-methyltransferase